MGPGGPAWAVALGTDVLHTPPSVCRVPGSEAVRPSKVGPLVNLFASILHLLPSGRPSIHPSFQQVFNECLPFLGMGLGAKANGYEEDRPEGKAAE